MGCHRHSNPAETPSRSDRFRPHSLRGAHECNPTGPSPPRFKRRTPDLQVGLAPSVRAPRESARWTAPRREPAGAWRPHTADTASPPRRTLHQEETNALSAFGKLRSRGTEAPPTSCRASSRGCDCASERNRPRETPSAEGSAPLPSATSSSLPAPHGTAPGATAEAAPARRGAPPALRSGEPTARRERRGGGLDRLSPTRADHRKRCALDGAPGAPRR